MQNGAVTSDRTQVFQVKVGDSTTVTTPSKTKLRYCSKEPQQGSGWFFCGFLHIVILINQSISVASQTQFF